MISSYFQGGLGNQLFQIAAAVSLAADNNDTAVFNLAHHDLPKQGRKCYNYVESILRNVNFSDSYQITKIYKEPTFSYKSIPYEPDLCLVGYFQSEKYFINNKEIIKELFSIDDTSNALIEEKYAEVLAKKPVSVHIRRGDYLSSQGVHPVCSKEYYRRAFEAFNAGSSETTSFLFFSDDIEWCKENFVGDNYYFAQDNEDYIDLYLMSKCAHHIIANSSFSWWAAWLNDNPERRVIAPDRWFGGLDKHETKDLRPDDWESVGC